MFPTLSHRSPRRSDKGVDVSYARFRDEAHAGILKIDLATADADAEAPFGGWKASGIGPPEHGASDREFYMRTQTVYTKPPA